MIAYPKKMEVQMMEFSSNQSFKKTFKQHPMWNFGIYKPSPNVWVLGRSQNPGGYSYYIIGSVHLEKVRQAPRFMTRSTRVNGKALLIQCN